MAEYISQQGLSALMWIGLILSVIFIAIRTQVQYANSRHFYVNDYWIFFALLCHIATVIVYQVAIPPMYEVQYFDYTTQTMTPAFMARAALYLRLQFAVDFLLWTTLWAVKFSLLFFFWRLFDSVRSPMRFFWWTMCAVTAATWVTLVVLQNLACDPIRDFFTLGKCSSARDVYYSNLIFRFVVGTDIAGDILIMIIPYPLLPKLQIPRTKKTILAAIFFLPIIPIIFAVCRLVIANPKNENVDPIKFQVYSMLENSSAIVTSCLPSLRLFVVNSRAQFSGGSGYKYKHGREYAAGQGDYFRSGVHGSGVGSSAVRVQAVAGGGGEIGDEDVFEMGRGRGRGEGQAVTENGSGSREIEEDTATQASSESQRGIVGGKRGVRVTREFSVR